MENLASLTSRIENDRLATKVTNDGNYNRSVQTYNPLSGWIHQSEVSRDGYYDKASRLVNIDKLMSHLSLVGDGKNGLKDTAVYTQDFLTVLEEANKQADLIEDNPGLPVANLIGAAATGSNLIETAYENVRRVNYLTDVVGKQYNLNDYNSLKMVTERRVSVLNVVGFTKSSSLLQGIPEIGDHTTPPPFEQEFETYEKSLYADSFRFEFGMRELKDSVIGLKSELVKEIPGLFLRMKDNKITTALNAFTVTSTLGTDWDAITAGNSVYDDDAAEDVEADEVLLDQYGGGKVLITTRAVMRAYHRNVKQVGIGGNENSTSLNDAGARTGRLALNPQVEFVINNSMDADAYAIAATNSWADLLRGTVSNVSYKNQLTPAATEGRITFDFNGFVQKLSDALKKHDGVTS